MKFSTLLLAAVLLSVGLPAHPQTIASAQKRYVGQKVVVTSPFAFEIVKEDQGRYVNVKKDDGNQMLLSPSYAGKMATVTSITTHDPEQKNAFGEIVEPQNPIVDLVIQTEDGASARIMVAVSSISEVIDTPGNLRDEAESQNKQKQELDAAVADLVGKRVYATALCTLYSIDSTLENKHELRLFPQLKPLLITAAKLDHEFRFDEVILKLQMPDGGSAMAIVLTFGSRVYLGNFLRTIPSYLTPREVTAIQARSLFLGMSKSALELSVGKPKRMNVWAKGGSQLIYSDNFTVFLNSGDRVENWQISGLR